MICIVRIGVPIKQIISLSGLTHWPITLLCECSCVPIVSLRKLTHVTIDFILANQVPGIFLDPYRREWSVVLKETGMACGLME